MTRAQKIRWKVLTLITAEDFQHPLCFPAERPGRGTATFLLRAVWTFRMVQRCWPAEEALGKPGPSFWPAVITGTRIRQ